MLPPPRGCPPNRLLVPPDLRSQVIHWAHTSLIACHPGSRRTLFVAKQRFWWPGMERDVQDYVSACPTCARNKASHSPLSGLLHPLPVPSRPWSDISLDFITGLPESEGNTVILTVVDRFSKMAHFIPLPKLPSAKETAEVMLSDVFRIHGFPKDIVSDRGPQFISQFWRAFCALLGATVSLSSGYHPGTVFLLWSTRSPLSALSGKRAGSSVNRRKLVSQTVSSTYHRVLTPTVISTPDQEVSVKVLIDSGADESFLDWGLARRLRLCVSPLASLIEAQALDGSLLFKVTHVTVPVKFIISDSHTEAMTFHLCSCPAHPVILGLPWLRQHNPRVDWVTGDILDWSNDCLKSCLSPTSPDSLPETPLTAPSPDSDYPNLSKVPNCYHDLKEVFNKAKATSLPPHRPFDCSIDLLPGAMPPRGRLYSLSEPERRSMKDYIDSSLRAGIIRHSSSPAGPGFSLWTRGISPCVPALTTVDSMMSLSRIGTPLPLISSAFELLQGASVFTKLDLRNAYHLVRIREGDEWKTAFNTPTGHYEYLVMPFGLTNAPAVFQNLVNEVLSDMLNQFVFVYIDDILIFSPDLKTHVQQVRQVLQRLLQHNLYVKAEKCEFHQASVSFLGFIISKNQLQMDPEKVKAVVEWPVPLDRKQLLRFLGFANFYRKFIRNYSSVAAPLHALTSSKVKFSWTPEADQAFERLRVRFTTAPILTLPDPERQFIVEVDASDVGVGAVLSQISADDTKLHPCAYLSCKLSPSERNYDIGNRELLAIKVALEEWRHWLEGAQQPFIVWTDHKNLEYVRTAKRLNSRQARWALFFNRLNFCLSYRPGAKNGKPDALSRIYSPDPSPEVHSNILPSSCMVGAVTWGIEGKVLRANANVTPT